MADDILEHQGRSEGVCAPLHLAAPGLRLFPDVRARRAPRTVLARLRTGSELLRSYLMEGTP
jgi:hypothetical protein